MSPVISLMRAEWLRMRSRSVGYILTLVGVGLMVAVAIGTRDDLGDSVSALSMVAVGYGSLLGVIACASFVGAEWGAGGITTMLTWDPRRGRVLAGKLLVSLATVAALAFAMGLLSVPLALGVGASLGDTDWGGAAELWGRAALLAAASGAVGFSLAVLFRGTVGALVTWFVATSPLVLLLPLLWEGFRDALPPTVLGGVTGGDLGRPLAILLGYTGVLAAGAFVAFARRDV